MCARGSRHRGPNHADAGYQVVRFALRWGRQRRLGRTKRRGSMVWRSRDNISSTPLMVAISLILAQPLTLWPHHNRRCCTDAPHGGDSGARSHRDEILGRSGRRLAAGRHVVVDVLVLVVVWLGDHPARQCSRVCCVAGIVGVGVDVFCRGVPRCRLRVFA